MDFLLAILPVIILVLLIVVFNRTLLFSSPFFALSAIFVAVLRWSVPYSALSFPFLKGTLIALDICIIVFGALWFLETMKSLGYIDALKFHLHKFAPDIRIQALILTWGFGSFLEAVAGFGTPAAIVGPLLVTLGISPVISIVVALLADSTAVPFGAIGTPIRFGLQTNISATLIGNYVAYLNVLVGWIVPLAILFIVHRYITKSHHGFLPLVPFGMVSAFAFTIPAYAASFVGVEFPSIVGSVCALAVMILCSKYHLLIPKKTITGVPKRGKHKFSHSKIPFLRAISPYILLALVLLGIKYVRIKYVLDIGGGLTHSFGINPGYIFLILALLYQMNGRLFLSPVNTLKKLRTPFVVLFFVAGTSQLLFFTSSFSPIGLLQTIGLALKGPIFPFFTPFIGSFGSFFAGSATVSNLLFGKLVEETAIAITAPVALLLAAQTLGGGIGNMFALSNIIAAQSTVGVENAEKDVIVHTLPIALLYLFLTGILVAIFL